MEKVRVGLWGVGRAGWTMHKKEVARFSDMLEIVGCCDLIPERMEKFCEEVPGCKAYPNIDDMLKAEDIDVISVATRSPDHVEHAIKALESGKFVFAEKPIGINYAEVLKLKAASEKYPGKLMCRHNRRFEAAFQHISEIIASGKLGEIYMIKLSRHAFQRRFDWQALRSFGGGQLNNWGPHLIDHALQFINAPLKSVWADLRTVNASGDAEDHVKAVLTGENGMVVDIEISGGTALPCPVYAVYGNKGALIAQTEKEFKLKYMDVEKCTPKPQVCADTPAWDAGFSSTKGMEWIEETIACAPASGLCINDIYKFVYATVREGKPFPIKNEEAFEVARVTELIRKAAGQE